jgi:PAS domain S-box-containing protein
MAGALCVIIFFRLVSLNTELWFFIPLLSEALMFLGLLWLNRMGQYNLSRILLCWAPPILLMIDFKILILHVAVPETSHYFGFRIFQVAFSVFPFLLFNLSESRKLIIALFVPIAVVLFNDKLLNLIGAGYHEMGLTDRSYLHNNFRTTIALFILASAFIFLKFMLENEETKNKKLIEQLENQNILIEQNSKRELKKAYDKLSYHINHTPLAVIERDKDFHVTYWNKRAEELFGWSVTEVAGQKILEFLIHPDDRAVGKQSICEAVREERDSIFIELRAIAKNGTARNCLWYYSFLRNDLGELDTVLSFVSDITDQRKANYLLNERIKEQRTLYNVSQLLSAFGKSMEDVFSTLTSILPNGWQYPEICAARLVVFGSTYQTPNYRTSPYSQSIAIRISGRQLGVIEVVYLNKKSDEDEGLFYKEERDLLIAIAQMLQVYIQRKLEEEELLKAQANLSATINNTEIIIWSVDQNFIISTFNEAFRKFAVEVLDLSLIDLTHHRFFPFSNEAVWQERYQRVFTGEIFTLEETVGGIDYRYSLSPIIDNAKIIGVSIFADNVTEQNQRNRVLAEAKKNIAEMKIMALLSVMNPHFIFNVLSSIQYFITRNDELNAINYLTSFSKLMRTVLTRSVADVVSLKDELDLVRDYVHLEKLRFEEKFDFSMHCDDAINADDVKMPSLLIQPYVENAILHGLYNKEGSGSLCVKVSLENDFLLFQIQDDGVGRSRSQLIHQKSIPNKKSMGTQLTEERLAIHNGDSRPPVIYTDLYDGDQPAGTHVAIRVRINPN